MKKTYLVCGVYKNILALQGLNNLPVKWLATHDNKVHVTAATHKLTM